jgi:hypothetical protein
MVKGEKLTLPPLAFRILLVDLTELGSSGKSPLKYLIMSFVFDVIELWTLSAWCLVRNELSFARWALTF